MAVALSRAHDSLVFFSAAGFVLFLVYVEFSNLIGRMLFESIVQSTSVRKESPVFRNSQEVLAKNKLMLCGFNDALFFRLINW